LEERYASKPTVILISGKAGVGKTEASLLLSSIVDSKGYIDFVTLNFAYGVKHSATDCFSWDGKKDTRGRILLQQVGRIGRDYYKDIWAKQLAEKILSNPCEYDFIFIDDWRFPNEEIFLKKTLGKNYLVVTLRILAPNREILKGTKEYDDISETALNTYSDEDFDFCIDNSGNLIDLKEKLKLVIKQIEKKLEATND